VFDADEAETRDLARRWVARMIANGTAPHLWGLGEANAAGAECLAAALDYRRRGWPPTCCCPPDHIGVGRRHGQTCKSPGKAPMHTWKQYRQALPTINEINHWWKSWPNANTGMVLGTVFVRVDADGDAGQKRLRELCGGGSPRTLAFTSGRADSIGLLYAVPAGVELQTRREGFAAGGHDELRLQGPGAQTVLPPSRHPLGTRYRWLDGRGPGEIEAAPMPPWMVQLMRVPQREGHQRARTRGELSHDMALALSALAALDRERADDYDDWLRVGMALHSVDDGDELRDAWDEWSRGSEKYKEGECEAKWATFDRERVKGVTLGTLIHTARQDGWVRPWTARTTVCRVTIDSPTEGAGRAGR
jgi:hypothetical protein